MKSLVFVLAFLTVASASATTGLVSTSIGPGGRIHRTCGFDEDGFNSPDDVCYRGRTDEVCAVFERSERESDEAYADGGHGRFEIEKCEAYVANPRIIHVSYKSITDYDRQEPQTKTLLVDRCKAEVRCGN